MSRRTSYLKSASPKTFLSSIDNNIENHNTYLSNIALVINALNLPVGSFNNTANGLVTSTSNEKTIPIDIQNCSHINISGNVSAHTTINTEVSQNNINWFNTSHSSNINGSVPQDFYMDMDMASRYIRLSISNTNVTVNATIAGKK